MTIRYVTGLFAAISTALSLGWAPVPANAQSGASRDQVMLVLDASGSMWGQIDGVSKIEIAREQIADMVGAWDPAIDLGLISYGHRERGACGDIEIVRAPGPLDADAFTSSVNGLSPLGMTPLTDSVRLAAETMRYSEQKATVILLSDGLENCEADPCALARELESVGIDFTAHVIGFDIDAAEAAELSCLAETTGGEFFLAGNADTLTASLRQTVEAIAEPEPEPEIVVEPAPEPEPEPEPVPEGPTGLTAQAKLCETCDLLTEGVFWTLLAPGSAADGAPEQIATDGRAAVEFELDAGDYVLRARVGEVIRDMPVAVDPGQVTEAILNLRAGNLRLRAEAAPGGTPLEDSMFYRVYSAEVGLNGEREQITSSGRAIETFTLSDGPYHIVARHGDAFAAQDVEVREGALSDITIDMNVGYVRVGAIPTAGAETLQDNMFYRVFEQQADLQGNRSEVTTSGAPEPLFRLPAGDYLLVGRHGEAFAEQAFSVSADALTTVSLDMNVGYLRVTSTMAEGMPPLDSGVFYRVNEGQADLAGNRDTVTSSGSAESLFRLTEGAYQLVTRHGAAFTTTDISVTAGRLAESMIVLGTAILRAQAVTEEGGAPLSGGVFWTVLASEEDLSGGREQIVSDGLAQPQLIVKAGDYLLRVRHEGEEFDFPFSLSPGEIRDTTFVLTR